MLKYGNDDDEYADDEDGYESFPVNNLQIIKTKGSIRRKNKNKQRM